MVTKKGISKNVLNEAGKALGNKKSSKLDKSLGGEVLEQRKLEKQREKKKTK
jgi:hypothetical protein